jgi:hypothetical protein
MFFDMGVIDYGIVGSENLPEPLQSVLAKLSRANEHLENLKAEVNAWVAGEPLRFEFSSQDDGAKHFVWSVFDPQPDLARWGVIVGDILHNLRSGLDHLAWRLVELSGETPTRNTAFPISITKAAWDQDSPRKVAGMAPAIVERIDKLQPYQHGDRADRTWLWQIHSLNNKDKHRLITPVVLSPSKDEAKVTSPARVSINKPVLTHKTVFMEVEPVESTPAPHVTFEFDLHVVVQIGVDARFEIGQAMTDLRNDAAIVVDKMIPFFL